MKVGGSYDNISSQEAIELGAIADQIIPADETPGATEIGVVFFIDAALGGFMAQAGPQLRQGLEDICQRAITSHPQIEQYSDLSFAQQTDILKQIENTPFFATVYFLTLSGMFCLPEYGGNRGNAGWDLLGFEHRHVWQAPFGYYDAAVLEAGGEHEQT